MQVKLSKLPDPKSIESVSIGNITGGLNLQSEPDGCASNQSPDMVNMWYENGCLRKRWGQKYIGNKVTGTQAVPVLWYDRLFDGKLVWLQGSSFYYATPAGLANPVAVTGVTIPTSTELGWFVPFEEYLFYKAPGVYIRLKVDDTTHAIVGESVFAKNADGTYTASDLCYTPVIAINRNPDGSGGDSYQPENRIQPKKTVWFDVDDESQDYYLPVHGVDRIDRIQIDDDYVDNTSSGWVEHRGTTVIQHNNDCILNGRKITLKNVGVSEDSPLFTGMHLSVPMDPDDTGWGDVKATDDTPSYGSYTKNVVWSNFDLYPNYYTKFNHATVLYAKDGALPNRYGKSLVEQGLSLIGHVANYNGTAPTDMKESYCVFDNGHYCNILAFPPNSMNGYVTDASEHIHTVKNRSYAQSGHTGYDLFELGFKDYRIATYNYDKDEWTTAEYVGVNGPVGHMSDNCVYSTFNTGAQSASGYLFDNEGGDGDGGDTTIGWLRPCTRARYSPYSRATIASGLQDVSIGRYFISESDTDYHFRFDYLQNLWVTSVNSDNTRFGMYGFINVVVNKKTLETASLFYGEPTAAGFKVENIKYSNFDIQWCGCYPPFNEAVNGVTYNVQGIPIIAKTSNVEDIPAEYGKEEAYARMKAVASYALIMEQSTKFFIVNSDKYHARGYWFIEEDGGVLTTDIAEWDCKTTEIKLKYVISVYKDTAAKKIETEVGLTTPAVLSNRIRVTYSKYNADAFRAIAECKVATDYGGSDAVCITMANCTAQPNALFWSGNGSAGVDPCYFPMDQYNLVGAYQDPITALSKWQSYLIILQEHRTSKGNYNIETNTATSRNFIDIPVATINPERGCDMPRSVRLCSNNLVWAHSTHGVLYLQDTSYANENAVIRISENVNGTKYRPGLLKALADNGVCCSMDDGKRYFLFCGKDMFCWDYSLSSLSDAGVSGLSWTRHELPNTIMSATTCDTRKMYLLDKLGSRIEMGEDYTTDLGAVIPCKYTTPTQTFGGYYKLRNISKVLLKCSSIEGGSFLLRYGGERSSNPANEMDVALKCSQQIDIPAREFDSAIVLRPRILHIHNFYFIIESAGNDGGLAIDNALILYTSQGVTR